MQCLRMAVFKQNADATIISGAIKGCAALMENLSQISCVGSISRMYLPFML